LLCTQHVLTYGYQTPTTAGNLKGIQPSSAWHIGRFRANLFTRSEISGTWPLDRDAFSIGAEQSLSNVVGLAWSPAGLATHRRCLLAVLTSNQALSFWEGAGDGSSQTRKWTRVAVANHMLKKYFASLMQETDNDKAFTPAPSQAQSQAHRPRDRHRKRRVRSFTWLPPLNQALQKEQSPSTQLSVKPRSRWGHHLLAVANDFNDVIILRIERQKFLSGQGIVKGKYVIAVLSHVSIDNPVQSFPAVYPGSLLASALQSHARVIAISAGPWIHDQASPGVQREHKSSAKLILGAVCGGHLALVDLAVESVTYSSDSSLGAVHVAQRSDISVSGVELDKIKFKGPLHWVSNVRSKYSLFENLKTN
jgi:hypothetical protein